MSSTDFGEDLSRSNLSLEMIAKLMTAAQQQNLPVEDDLTPDYETVSPLEDIHDVSIIAGIVDLNKEETVDHVQELPYLMRTPENPYPYDLIHTTVGSGFGFPDSGKKHAGRISDNANTHIKVDHDADAARLDMGAGTFAIAFWIIKTSSGTYGIVTKRDIANTTNAGIEIWVDNTTIYVRIADGTNSVLLSGTLAALNDGNWHSVIINIPDTGNLEIFIDNVSKGTVSRGSVASINNTRDVIICGRDNNGTIQDKLVGDFAWFVWKKTEIFDATQRNDFHSNGLLDLAASADVEVITIPGILNENPMPNCTPSLFSTA
ncbi:MAG: hypothetical protein K5785_01025 [Nitrosarchaeum sp.]|nr:hypothetical protein [Nitrosarchaeum sp.]